MGRIISCHYFPYPAQIFSSKISYLTLSEGHSCHKAVILHIVPVAGRAISRMTWTRGKKWNQLLQLALREDWFLRVTYGAQLMGLGFCRLPGNWNLCTNVPGVLNALFFIGIAVKSNALCATDNKHSIWLHSFRVHSQRVLHTCSYLIYNSDVIFFHFIGGV